ncbi:hypothetical protein PR002_g23168 [Phytophthora rubi]|uniref:Uncharacterized protein n=1 Tax=Phytophthora rubi TaxID=129364 RepID=A0A6A3ISI1_9STRA|nr:hypothetical protein PR002_g23168 [Phytophthora rubi]
MSGKRAQPSITNFFAKKPRPEPDDDSGCTKTATPLPLLTSFRSKQDHAAREWCTKYGVPDSVADCTIADFVKRDPA